MISVGTLQVVPNLHSPNNDKPRKYYITTKVKHKPSETLVQIVWYLMAGTGIAPPLWRLNETSAVCFLASAAAP